MNFAFIIFKYFPFGGMQRDMLRTANELVKRGHSVEIFTMSWDDVAPQASIKVHVLPQKGWFNYKRYQKFIRLVQGQIATGAFDYVMGYNRMPGLDAHFAADPCFVARTYAQRGFLARMTPRYKWFQQCEEVIFSSESKCEILMVSETEKAHFQHWYQTQDARFHYIPPYLSAERLALRDRQEMRQYLRQVFNFTADDIVLIQVGSGFSMKGLDRSIAAVAALPANVLKHVKLLAIGQDNPSAFNKLAQKLGVAEHVVISKGRADIPLLMQGADIFLHPAYRENTGLVILEALASGLPSLVTDTCGYAHHVADARAGMVVPSPFDQAAFNRMLLQLLESDDKAQLRSNGLKYSKRIMQENDGSAEAEILIRLAQAKKARHG